ncbi:MAG: nitrate reductase [Pseudomonadota bacterium]
MENGDEPRIDRRDLLRLLAGVASANALGVAAWGALEALLPKGNADSWTKAVCRFCGTGCGIQIGMRAGRVTDVRGDELAHNAGVICVKGSMLRALPYVEGRLTTPMIRRGGKGSPLTPASWEEAMTLVASKFEEAIAAAGPDSVAFYGSGQLFTEESYTANKLFKAGIRTNNVDGNPRLCMASAATGYTQTFGKDEPPGSYEDIDHAECLFVIGANPFHCHPPLHERMMRRKRLHPETTIICVDPRRTDTAYHADIHLAPVPGTDLLLLNSMAQVICADGLVDVEFVKRNVRFTDGDATIEFDAFKAFLDASYTPEQVSQELGITANDIRLVAHRFAKAKATMSLWTMGLNQRTQGTALNAMVSSLHLLTGQFGRPGATPFSVTGQPNACGGVRDTGALSHALPNGRVVANPKHREEMEQIWGLPAGTISPKPGLPAVDLFQAMGDGKVHAALIMCTNPAQSLPNSAVQTANMSKAFLAVAEIFADSETAQVADVLLPAALWIEKEGVTGQGERRYQYTPRLLDPPGQCRSDLAILVDLADRLGLGKLISARTPETVWDEWRQVSAHSKYNFAGITYPRLKALRGLQWPCPTTDHPGTVRRFVEGSDPFVGPGKGIEFYGFPDGKAVVATRPYVRSPEMPSAEFPLQLTTGRVVEQWHTGTMTMRIPELRDGAGPAQIEISPSDADRAHVATGARLRITSRFGSIEGFARISDRCRPGTLFAAFYDVKLLINRVVADHVDPVSKEPEYKLTAVRLELAQA